jgi:hypothetical protein
MDSLAKNQQDIALLCTPSSFEVATCNRFRQSKRTKSKYNELDRN